MMGRQPGLQQAISDFRAMKEAVKQLEAKAPRIVAKEAVDFIHENFEKQSYNGVSWKARSPATNKAYDKRYGVKGSVFSSSNPILRQTGNLYDAVRSTVNGTKVFVGLDTNKVPYGMIHNEGGVINKKSRSATIYFSKGRFATAKVGKSKVGTSKNVKIGAHAITMPKRQFLPKPSEPENPTIMNRVVKKLIFERDRLLRSFRRK